MVLRALAVGLQIPQHSQPCVQWGCRQRPTGVPPKGAARRSSAFLQAPEQWWLMQTRWPADQGEPHFFLSWIARLTPSPARTILAGHTARARLHAFK